MNMQRTLWPGKYLINSILNCKGVSCLKRIFFYMFYSLIYIPCLVLFNKIFNPCFNGSAYLTSFTKDQREIRISLNPCFNGSASLTGTIVTTLIINALPHLNI